MSFAEIEKRFKVIKVLGRGSYGKVVLCKYLDEEKNKKYGHVALKIVEIDSNDMEGINYAMKEILHLKNKEHRNIVHYIDCFLDRTKSMFAETLYLCIVMEYLNCGNIGDVIKLGEDCDEDFILALIYQVSQGLTFLQNECELIHRDLSPRNIMMVYGSDEADKTSEKEKTNELNLREILDASNPYNEITFKIVDFGLVKHEHSVKQSSLSAPCGTLKYISPEMMKNSEYSYNTDIFSLGCIVMELVMMEDMNVYIKLLEKGEKWVKRRLIERSQSHGGYSNDLIDLLIGMIKIDRNERRLSHEVKERCRNIIKKRQLLVYVNPNEHINESVFVKLPFGVLLLITQEFLVLNINPEESTEKSEILTELALGDDEDEYNDDSQSSDKSLPSRYDLNEYFGYFSRDRTRTIFCIFTNLESQWSEEDVLEKFSYFSNHLPTRYLRYWNYSSGIRHLFFSEDFYKRATRLRAVQGVQVNQKILNALSPHQLEIAKIQSLSIIDDGFIQTINQRFYKLKNLSLSFKYEDEARQNPNSTLLELVNQRCKSTDFSSHTIEILRLHNQIPASFTFVNCKKLRVLSIWDSELSESNVMGIVKNDTIEVVQIRYCSFKHKSQFFRLFEKKNMRSVDLSGCTFHRNDTNMENEIESFARVKNPSEALESVVLSRIVDIPIEFFEVLLGPKTRNLVQLRLEFCKISNGFLNIILKHHDEDSGFVREKELCIYIRYMDRKDLNDDLFGEIRGIKNVRIYC